MVHLAGLYSCCIVCGWVLKWISSLKTKTMRQVREKILKVNDWCVFFLLPPSWFLVYPWWQKGLPNLQESTEDDPASTTVWLLQQNWKTYCKPLRTHGHTQNFFSFSTKMKKSEFTPALCVRSKKSPETSHSLTWPLMMSCSWIPGNR